MSEKPKVRKCEIRCCKCYEFVAVVDLEELELPMRGSMLMPRVGCEHWPLPTPGATPRDFVCPHAVGGDLHLFHPGDGPDWDACDTLMLHDYTLLKVEKPKEIDPKDLCPCGCGRPVGNGNKYADRLSCYRRHVQAMGNNKC